jgi:hypothetical protein
LLHLYFWFAGFPKKNTDLLTKVLQISRFRVCRSGLTVSPLLRQLFSTFMFITFRTKNHFTYIKFDNRRVLHDTRQWTCSKKSMSYLIPETTRLATLCFLLLLLHWKDLVYSLLMFTKIMNFSQFYNTYYYHYYYYYYYYYYYTFL